MKIFLDSDVILDLLIKRSGYQIIGQIFNLAEESNISLFTSPVTLSNIFYIVSKHVGGKKALNEIKKLNTILTVVRVGQKEVELSLDSSMSDFEDGLQYFAAINSGVDYLMTRNTKDYPKGELPVIKPKEMLALLVN